jgi:hypothetical protein
LLVGFSRLFVTVMETGRGVLVRVGVAVGDPGVGVGGGGPQGEVKSEVSVMRDISLHESR